MFKLSIIRKALNLSYDLNFAENTSGQKYIWYPYFLFVSEGSINETRLKKEKILGKITAKGITYNIICRYSKNDPYIGLGCFDPRSDFLGLAHTNVGFLGCATKEIAQHFGEYFGMLIVEAMYGDIENFEIIK